MQLKQFFEENPRAALAFSGGADSAYLLYAGLSLGADIKPYCVSSGFQPEFELRDARRLARELGAKLEIIELDVLASAEIRRNAADRCYHCKRLIMSAIRAAAARDGYALLLDGTNASDEAGDRPGMRAIAELDVRSPLRECGLDKAEIRELSGRAGLFTWDKPAYACLATRIKTGEEISAAKLARVEKSEEALFALGFSDFRVRLSGEAALLQFTPGQLAAALARRDEIEGLLRPFFETIDFDPEGRAKSL